MYVKIGSLQSYNKTKKAEFYNSAQRRCRRGKKTKIPHRASSKNYF